MVGFWHVALYHTQQVEPTFHLFHIQKRSSASKIKAALVSWGQKLGIFQRLAFWPDYYPASRIFYSLAGVLHLRKGRANHPGGCIFPCRRGEAPVVRCACPQTGLIPPRSGRSRRARPGPSLSRSRERRRIARDSPARRPRPRQVRQSSSTSCSRRCGQWRRCRS